MKYVYPKCQSQLTYWEEFVFKKERTVNKATGELNKKTRKTKEIDIETHGLACSNEKCRFEYNGNSKANQDHYPQLDRILENWS